ncbi:MAG: M28 family peptidase [Blastocatellia bacterium]
MNERSPRCLPLRALIGALVIIQLVAPLSFGQTSTAKPAPALSAAEREAASLVKAATIRDVTLALTASEMQGRGTGQPGADRAAKYIAERFAKLGLKPLGDQMEGKTSYLQAIKFKAEQVQPDATFTAGDVSFKYKDDFVVPPPLPQDDAKEGSGSLAFVGYGALSKSPDIERNDLGDINPKGKVAVVLTGKPDNVDPAVWARSTGQGVFVRLIGRGVAGIVVVYEAARETQPFSLVATYLSRRRVSLPGAAALPIKLPPIVLISDKTAERLFANTGESFTELKAKAKTGAFVSRELNKSATISLRVKREEVTSSNVVGVMEGADAALKSEAVVYSAHYDAYGIDVDGTVYPGAADNALGIGKLMAIAEAFAKAKAKPRRSIIFLAVTGEEYGLLGAEYWVKRPTWPLEKVAADINYDGIGTEVWGELHYLINYGFDHSQLGNTIADVAAAMKAEIVTDPFPDEGVFYRSDHYAFFKRGVPSLYLISGPAGDQAAIGARAMKWLVTDYHMASDTVQKDWNWTGAEQLAVIDLLAGMRVANQDTMPAWISGSPYNRPRGTTEPPPRQ